MPEGGVEKWVLIVSGEGAEARLASGDLHQPMHDFMCLCGKPWKKCTSAGVPDDLKAIDDPDEWETDESNKPFGIHWRGETGTVSAYKLSVGSGRETPATSAEKIIQDEIASSTGPTGGWLDSPKAVCASIIQKLRVAQSTASEHLLRNLLAVIHRDAGQYVANHGLQKASEDAENIVAELIHREPSAAPEEPTICSE